MRLFVSIVSHLHQNIIINLGTARVLAEYPEIEVVCRDNIPNGLLKKTCNNYGIHYIPNKEQRGFSGNNNANFIYCKEELGMKGEDVFITLNPDVYMTRCNIKMLLCELRERKPQLSVPNLFLDKEEFVYDDNIRLYPKFSNFVKTYLLNDRSTMVNRKQGLAKEQSYWASGAFLIYSASLYQKMRGLDEQYYMYCEDIDACARLKMKGIHFDYLEEVKAVHFRRRDSKRFMTKYFFWHVCSVFRYSFSSRKFEAKKTQIK
ncbi:glycosyltransferase family 2 protein [Vibrio sp. 10N.222.51.C5]|uniref:glycosyltransferase family 2 protein n=1 Tax=Vibrio sp. 10N.222.51.C5 TaxID=3229623 RepID=UPI0035507D5D